MATTSESAKIGASTARRGVDARAETARQNVGAGARRGGFSATGTQSTPQNWQEVGNAAKQMAVKGGPVLFWFVAGFAVIKDVIDVFSVFLDAVGVALDATVVGAVVGIPLSVFSEVIDKFAGLFIDFTIVAYFGYIGGGFALRLVIISVAAIIDAIPVLDVLPLTTISFFAAYLFGRASKAVAQSTMASKGVQTAKLVMKVAKYI